MYVTAMSPEGIIVITPVTQYFGDFIKATTQYGDEAIVQVMPLYQVRLGWLRAVYAREMWFRDGR